MNRHVIERPTMKWHLFFSASLFVGGLLVKVGAPMLAVVGGIGLAALWNWKCLSATTRWGTRAPK
jgi:hypothetical protein